MKINQQGAPQITQSNVDQVQQKQPMPSMEQTTSKHVANQFEQGAATNQLVPPPSMDQSAPRTGQSLLSLQIGQMGQTDQPITTDQTGQVTGPDLNPRLTRVQDAAKALMAEVHKIQGRMTEELRTEDAIVDISVGKGEHDYRLDVVMGPHSAFTPPQVENASKALLHELGYEGMDINVIAPAVNPFPGPGTGELAPVPVELQDNIKAAIEPFFPFGTLPTLDQKPNVDGMEHYLLRDNMPADGSRDEVFIDRATGNFYMSSTILSRMGPAHSGTSWHGPFELGL